MVLGKQSKNNVHPSKIEVGEIDTSSPFESVKHAVSLFGAVAFTRRRTQLSGRKLQTQSSEKLSAKESRLHLAQKELNKLKENLQMTDVTRSLALAELKKTKKTIDDLNRELSAVGKSKDAVLKETEISNDSIENLQGKSSSNIFDRTLSSCRRELDTFTVQYLATALELNEAKKGLGWLRQEYDSVLRSYNAVLKQSSEAEAASHANNEAAVELSEKISSAKKLIERVKLASEQAEQEKSRIEANREIIRHECNFKLDASAKPLKSLKREHDPETTRKLQKQLESIYNQSEALKQDVHKAKDSYSARMLDLELEIEKGTLQKLLDEESSLQRFIESLNIGLDNLKKQLFGMNVKEAEARHLAEDLEAELQKSKLELEKCMTEESNLKNHCDEMKATLVDLLTETQGARQDTKDIMLETQAAMKEAEADRHSIIEHEAKLQLLMQEVEAAKSAEAEVLSRVKIPSESKYSGAKITLSCEELDSLSVKIKDSAKLADIVTMVQAEAVKTRQNVSQKKLKASQRELEELKQAIVAALGKAGKAEADKTKLEGELERLHQCFLNEAEHVPNSKTYCENPKGISKSHSTSSANRKRVTLGDILKMDREVKGEQKRGRTRSLSGIFHGTTNELGSQSSFIIRI